VAQYKDLIPKNFEMTAAKLKEYFASKPYGTDQAEWVKYYLDMADREKGAAQKYIEDITTSRIPINGSPLRKQDPKKFDQVLKGKGLNPDSFDADGLPIKGKDVHFYNDKDLDTKPKGWTDDWVIYKTTSGKRYWAPPGNAVPGKSSVEAR
jgi:hypothetical protein